MNVFNSGKNLEVAGIEIDARAHGGQHRLPLPGGAMHGETHPDQVFDHLLDLLIRRCFLHGNNHIWSIVVSLRSSANAFRR